MLNTVKFIPLSKGQFAIVDEADFEWLNQWKWFYHPGAGGYAARNSEYDANGKRHTILMHRQILGMKKGSHKGFNGDHRNRERLDNRRSNLRIITTRENNLNSNLQKSNKSGYRGVNWWRSRGPHRARWTARIAVKGKRLFLGYFKCPIKAAKAYDKAAKKHNGKFAQLNFPKKKE